MIAIVALKVLLDAVATIGFAISRQWSMALMFTGFTIADLGAALLALR